MLDTEIIDAIANFDYPESKVYLENGRAVQQIHIGGMEGGSCWGDSSQPKSYTASHIEENIVLESILEAIYPAITFLEYRKLLKLIDIRETSDGSDWYGNYSNYRVYSLDIGALAEALTNLDC